MLSRAARQGRLTAEMLERHTFQAEQKMGFYAGIGSMAPAPPSLSKPTTWPWGQINQGGCLWPPGPGTGPACRSSKEPAVRAGHPSMSQRSNDNHHKHGGHRA